MEVYFMFFHIWYTMWPKLKIHIPNTGSSQFYMTTFGMISLSHSSKIYTTFQIYATIFGLTQFGVDDL